MRLGKDLRDILGYRIRRANLLVDADVREALEPFAVSPAKVTALLLIRDHPGCDQTALGRALSVNRSSAMKLVNILVELGLVERRPGRDARSNALHLTEFGDVQTAAMLDAIRMSDARISVRLTDAELKQLKALLDKLGLASDQARGRTEKTAKP